MFRLMGKIQTLARVYFTFFIDTLGWAIVFPIFAPYFAPLLTLGLFLMAFPLGQFIFAPILGGWADRYGKRRILALTVLLSFFGMALTAWSFQINHLPLLFLSRLVTGCCAGNMSLCLFWLPLHVRWHLLYARRARGREALRSRDRLLVLSRIPPLDDYYLKRAQRPLYCPLAAKRSPSTPRTSRRYASAQTDR